MLSQPFVGNLCALDGIMECSVKYMTVGEEANGRTNSGRSRRGLTQLVHFIFSIEKPSIRRLNIGNGRRVAEGLDTIYYTHILAESVRSETLGENQRLLRVFCLHIYRYVMNKGCSFNHIVGLSFADAVLEYSFR